LYENAFTISGLSKFGKATIQHGYNFILYIVEEYYFYKSDSWNEPIFIFLKGKSRNLEETHMFETLS